MRVADLINPFKSTETPPPQTLGAFIRWSLSGAWPMIFVAAFFSASAGAMEAGTAWILGRVIDVATQGGPEGFLSGSNLWVILGGAAFFMLLRPVFFGMSALSNNYVVMPNITPLVLAKLNRWTLGQSVTFIRHRSEPPMPGRLKEITRAPAFQISSDINPASRLEPGIPWK